MKMVLVACEYSGVVRHAFRKHGYFAYSCDLLPSEDGSIFHYQQDVREVLDMPWDLVIAFPPCTHLAVSGAAWFAQKRADGRQQEGIDFFNLFTKLDHVRYVAIENPVGIMSNVYRKPDQIIQPWMFGHTEQKATCLWLKGLPRLVPTHNVRSEMMMLPRNKRERLHYLPPSADRWKERSRTFSGVGEAMAEQWIIAMENDNA